MIDLLGLVIGAFLGFFVADFLGALDPLRAALREAISVAREKATEKLETMHPLAPIGTAVLLVVVVFVLLGFSSTMLLGLVLGVVYKEEIGQLPFISGFAEDLRKKISGPK